MYNSIFGLQNKHFVCYSTMTWHIGSNVSNTSGSYYNYCTKLLLQPLYYIFWQVKRVSTRQSFNSSHLVARRDKRAFSCLVQATRQANHLVWWTRRGRQVVYLLALRPTRLVSPCFALWPSLIVVITNHIGCNS